MTTEEKAKRFDEVVEEFRGLLEGVHEDKCDIMEEDILKIVPELKISEDERIRKVLIDYFNRYKEQEECGVKTFYGIPTDNILAWLEKQGEKKPAWTEEDRDLMYDTLSNLTELKDLYGKDYGKVGKCIDWLKSLKERLKGK